MAQVFPLNVDDLSPDEGRASLAGTLAALPDPWTLLRHRRIGDEEAEPVEVVPLHPEIRVAPVHQAPRRPPPSARRPPTTVTGGRSPRASLRFPSGWIGRLPPATRESGGAAGSRRWSSSPCFSPAPALPPGSMPART